MLKKSFSGFVLIVTIVLLGQAHAALTIEITQSADGGLPIAIVPFKWSGKGKPPHNLSKIITSDLLRSGRFQILDKDKFISEPSSDKEVVFKEWRIVKAEALLIGRVIQLPTGQYRVEYRLYDTFKEKQLAGFRYVVGKSLLRTAAHQISDVVYEKLTGEPGAFTTRIAYVTREGKGRHAIFKLQIADSDGYGAITVVKSREPLMSPAWSPDGNKIAYVSFERKRSMVYEQNVSNGRRKLLAQFEGINSAPAWSPDGKKLALTLSKDGNAEIYLMDIATGRLERLTQNSAIDTEPAWSPEGDELVFTSDRAGGPQIYRMKVANRQVERLTFEGSYNARASYSADGSKLALVTRQSGRYHVGVLSLEDYAMQVLTDTRLDESPSFAPNGRILLYATEQGGRGVLASVSVDGRVRQSLRSEKGDVREPAWSPYNRQLRYK